MAIGAVGAPAALYPHDVSPDSTQHAAGIVSQRRDSDGIPAAQQFARLGFAPGGPRDLGRTSDGAVRPLNYDSVGCGEDHFAGKWRTDHSLRSIRNRDDYHRLELGDLLMKRFLPT
jgi:hypothetical protein